MLAISRSSHGSIRTTACAALLVAACAASAHAVILTPNNTVNTPGTDVGTRTELHGLVLEDVLRPFTITDAVNGSISGDFQDRVVLLYDNGVDATGGTHLSFEYRIRDTTGVSDPAAALVYPILSTVARTSYDTSLVSLTDVDFRTDSEPPSGGLGSDTASRSSGTGSTVTFSYANGINGGLHQESHFSFIRTDAIGYDENGSATLSLSTGQSVTFAVFQPSLIPAPTGAGLLGLGALAVCRRRRRR